MDARTDPGLDPRLEALLEHVEWARGLAGRLVADAARADDVVQSALAAATKSPPRDATNLRGWLGQVVRNAARAVGREEARRDRRERAAAKPEALEGADELVARAEMSRDLAQHVLALDEIYRDVVLLRWYEGLAPREIAQKLDLPVATVNTRLARAHGELRTRLDRAYGDRSTWCVAFAPFAVMPRAGLPAAAILVGMCLTIVVGAIGFAALRADAQRAGGRTLADGELLANTGAEPREPLVNPPTRDARSIGVSAGESVPNRSAADRSENAVSLAGLGTVSIHGRVLGFDGRGIPGLELRARDPSLPRIADGWLRIGNDGIQIRDEDLREWREVPPALERTLAHYGNPVGLREVLLGADLAVTTKTGPDGEFALDVPGSRANVESADASWILVASGRWESIDDEVILAAPAVRVSGTVVDDGGAPVPSARISAQGVEAAIGKLPFEIESFFASEEEVRSNAVGAFDLESTASFPGARILVAVETQIVAETEMPTRDTAGLVLVAKIRPVPAKPRVRGTVVDARGAGIAGAHVRIAGSVAQTDDSGRFDLEESGGFDPESELVAIKQGLSPAWIPGFGRELRAKRSIEGVLLQIPGPALSITGRAVDADGDELDGWYLSLADAVRYPSMGIPLEFAAAGLYGREQQPKTDAAGRFEFPGLAPQAYRLQLIDRRSGLVLTSDPIEAGARDVELRLPADAWREEVRGRTISKLGVPVAGVEIAVLYPITVSRGSSSHGHAQKTRSDSDAEFELENVPRRGLQLGVSGRQIRTDTIVVPDDVDPNDVVLTVTVERRFQLETSEVEHIDQFEVLDRSGKRLSIEGHFAHARSTMERMQRDVADFPVCTVSEEGATIVLYSKDREVRRAPITWTGERTQSLRP